jgi:hypothetical protein
MIEIYTITIGRWQIKKELIVNNKEVFFLAIIFMVFNYISYLKRLYYRLMELTRNTSNIKDRMDYNSITIHSIF